MEKIKKWVSLSSVRVCPTRCSATYMPYGWVEKPVDGEPNRRERHTQFLLVVTLVFNVARKRTKKEKRGIELVCAALSADSDDEDMNA